MYFTNNLAFVNYFNSMINSLEVPVLQNSTIQKEILPISLQSFELNSSLLQEPKTLKEFIWLYQHKKENFDLKNDHIENNNLDSNKSSFFIAFVIDISLFVTALISLIVTIVVYLGCKHANLKSLVTILALQQITGAEEVSMIL